MNRIEFKSLFEQIINEALHKAKSRIDETVSANVMSKLSELMHMPLDTWIKQESC